MRAPLVFLFSFLFSAGASALTCDKYFIVYVENQTDGDIEFDYSDKEYALKMDHIKQVYQMDLEAIFHHSRTPVPNKCRHFISGKDLVPGEIDNKSNLDLIYADIADDRTNAPIDIFVLTHGTEDGEIEVLEQTNKYKVETVEKALLEQMPNSLRPRLGVFMDAACYGLSASLQATKAGFAAAVGSTDETLGPLVLREFLKGYLDGFNLEETAADILNTCVSDEIWRETIRLALGEDDIEKYCQEAVIAIVGDPKINIDYDLVDLARSKTRNRANMTEIGKEIEKRVNSVKNNKSVQNNRSFTRPQVPYKRAPKYSVDATAQYGDNSVYQVDINFDNQRLWKYVNLERISLDNKGYVGGKVSFIHEDSFEVMGVERDFKKGILFGVTIISVDKSWFVTGKKYSNGLSWKYAFSTEGKVGYLLLRDKAGQARSFANIGVKANNKVDVSYRNFILQTNTGYDFMPMHPGSSPVYSNGSLLYRKGNTSLGGYVDYNGITGVSGGFKLSIGFGGKRK